MPSSKILLDSNSYFRLAKSIHPLLNIEFGDKKYCLCVLKELDFEFKKNSNLASKFSWVSDPEFVENRKKRNRLNPQIDKRVQITRGFLRSYKNENHLGTSEVDIICLAHGAILKVPVVTDDGEYD